MKIEDILDLCRENPNHIFYRYVEESKCVIKVTIASMTVRDGKLLVALRQVSGSGGPPYVENCGVNPDDIFRTKTDLLQYKLAIVTSKIRSLASEASQLESEKAWLESEMMSENVQVRSKLSDFMRTYRGNLDYVFVAAIDDPFPVRRVAYIIGLDFVEDKVIVNMRRPTDPGFDPNETTKVDPEILKVSSD